MALLLEDYLGQENEPENFARIDHAAEGLPGLYRLTRNLLHGRLIFRYLIFDVKKNKYWSEMLKICGIRKKIRWQKIYTRKL